MKNNRHQISQNLPVDLSVMTASRLLIPLLVITLFISSKLAQADDLAWHDHRFMQILSRTQLDSLARIHATRQRDQATHPDVKARWQQTLAELARQEMWFADGQDRSEILQHNLKSSLAIQGIQDPLLRFRLQTETGRMIQTESQAALVTVEAASLYGKQPSSNLTSADKRLQQLQAEIQRLEATDREMSGRSGLFTSQQRKRARDELRTLVASIKCQQLHWLAVTSSANLIQPLNSLNAELDSMVRSTRIEESKTQLQVLLAELAARYSSEADYRLKMTPLLKEGVDVRPGIVAEIQIRHHLRQRNVDSAERYLAIRSTLTRLEKQKRLWLACEVCVGQTEQAMRLDDTALISSAKKRLNSLQATLSDSQQGTYADAARHCLQKAERILELGPELSDLVEQVDLTRQRGDNEKALQQISVALKTLPGNQSHAAKPALLLIATQLNIDLQLWPDAIIAGRAAATEFQQRRLSNKAAAADLLKCFAMAQVINERPNGRSEYLKALQAHGQTFTASPTSAIAAKWMLQLTSASSPDQAVQVALQRLKQSNDTAERSSLVATINNVFWQALTSSETKFDQQFKLWNTELQQVASTEIDSILKAGDHSAIAVQLIVSHPTVPQIDSWRQQLAKQALKRSSLQRDLKYQLLKLVLDAKGSVIAEKLQQQRHQILQRPAADLQQTFFYLARVLSTSRRLGKIQSGDILLARTIDQLTVILLNSAEQPAIVALKLLPTTSITASMTGDQVAMQQVMAAVSPKDIPPEDLRSLVTHLSQLSTQANRQQTRMTAELNQVLINFWQRLMTSQSAGSDLWLEGLIQMGTLSPALKDTKELKRQFQMANVLYPDWGDAKRKVRATAILKRLQQTP